MTLNDLGGLVLKQAEEKGWGHSKEMLVVSEKMILIHTEVSEMVEALHKKPKREKDFIGIELADILARALHLGRAWSINFDEEIYFKSRFKDIKNKTAISDADFLYFHTLISKGYDNYRHKRLKVFKRFLYRIAREVVNMAKLMGVDVEANVLRKMEINKTRMWDAKKLHGNYYK